MITMHDVWIDLCVQDIFLQRLSDIDVINSPSFIICPHSRKTLAPPAIAMWLGVMNAKRIDPSLGKKFVHPYSLVREKAGSFYIPFWIVYIDLFMSYVIVATQNHFWIFCFQLIEIIKKFIKPCIFERLPFFARCTRRKISIDQMHITKIKLQHSSFIITYFVPCSVLNMIRFYFCKYGHAAITFFLCAEPVI